MIRILLVMTIFFPVICFADFDYSAFDGQYSLEKPCEYMENDRVVTVFGDPATHSIRAQYAENVYPIWGLIEHINEGVQKFSSCWSDGLMGYSETTGNGNRLDFVIVYLKSGFMCGGGSEKYRITQSLERTGDELIWTMHSTDDDSSTECHFKKIAN